MLLAGFSIHLTVFEICAKLFGYWIPPQTLISLSLIPCFPLPSLCYSRHALHRCCPPPPCHLCHCRSPHARYLTTTNAILSFPCFVFAVGRRRASCCRPGHDHNAATVPHAAGCAIAAAPRRCRSQHPPLLPAPPPEADVASALLPAAAVAMSRRALHQAPWRCR